MINDNGFISQADNADYSKKFTMIDGSPFLLHPPFCHPTPFYKNFFIPPFNDFPESPSPLK